MEVCWLDSPRCHLLEASRIQWVRLLTKCNALLGKAQERIRTRVRHYCGNAKSKNELVAATNSPACPALPCLARQNAKTPCPALPEMLALPCPAQLCPALPEMLDTSCRLRKRRLVRFCRNEEVAATNRFCTPALPVGGARKRLTSKRRFNSDTAPIDPIRFPTRFRV